MPPTTDIRNLIYDGDFLVLITYLKEKVEISAMKIALGQTNPVIGDFAHNSKIMTALINKAKKQGCGLIVFPEMALCGYPPQDLLERPAFLEDHDKACQKLIAKSKGIGVICGAITRHTAGTGKPLHNSALLFENGKILFKAHKRLLPTYDVFNEGRYFEPAGSSQFFVYKGLRLGITICEDIWNDNELFPRRLYTINPVAELLDGANGKLDLIINLAASPYRMGLSAIKRKIIAGHAVKHKVPMIYVNQVGGQDSILFEGQSLAMNNKGRIIACAEQFKEDFVVVDTETMDMAKTIRMAKNNEDSENSTVLKALVMGTLDYVTKCGFKKGLVGLSGGIDSAVTAAIACQALGKDNILGVALPSPYTSQESIDDARKLAKNLGIHFEVLPIHDVFDAMLETLTPIFPNKPPDVTEQNIQARIRGNLLMALSNKFGYMLLSTGNKTEMAVGYCTLYGDLSGGLAVISDIPKCQVYKLAKLINRKKKIIPERIITKAPSAELAPDQKDQDDLPPYEILDQILRAYLEEDRSIKDIVAMGFDPAVVEDIVHRVRINEYKRKQAPMVLKVTTKAFGYGRRYPTTEKYQESSS